MDVKFTNTTAAKLNSLTVTNGQIVAISDTGALYYDLGGVRRAAYTHPTYTARTGKPTGNQTPAFGGTATVSQVTSDGTGHVTGMTDRTITIPSTLSNGTGTAGLIKTTSTVTSNSGYTACPVINGVPYYKDTNSTYSLSSFGITATAAELNYCDGVTSNIQTQLDGKVPTSRTVNGKALSSNISLTASDVGADASGSASAVQSNLNTHTNNGDIHFSANERTKLSGIANGAEVNQNAFSNVVVGSTTISADSKTDSLTIASGTGISVSGDATNDKVTITNSGVRSIATGTSNGTISVNTNGTSANVAVKGLGSAAYTASTAYDPSGSANTALTNAKAYTDAKIDALVGEGASETLDTIGEISQAIEDHQDVTDALNAAIGNKVDKVSGKGLSTNDFTTTYKNKLDGIATGANAYTHPTTSGNKHIPSGGSSGQILRWSADGTAVWGADNNTTYSAATQSASGLMSADDKKKLDGIATGANAITVDSALSSTSTNPVQNKVINTALAGKANSSHGNHVPTVQTANNAVFLRNDNTWQTVTPANIGAATSGHTHSSYVNQNAFSNVKVGDTTVSADTTTDTLTLVAGSNVTITPDATNDKITIAATDTKYTHPTYTAKSSGLYKVTIDSTGHVSGATAVTKSDITALGIPSSDTNTHYASKNVVGSSTATSNTTSALTNGNVYLNSVENGVVTSAHKISGSGATTVTSDANGNIVVSSTNTTYSAATTSANGLMTSAMVTKLNSIAEGANKYSLPTASSSTLGGVKTTSTVTSTSGLTACPIISGVPYYKDTDTTYTLSNITGTLSLEKGGTGATSASNARTNLGVPPTSHASTATTYGLGTASNYGHVKLSDSYTASSGAANAGVGASSLALYNAYDILNTNLSELNSDLNNATKLTNDRKFLIISDSYGTTEYGGTNNVCATLKSYLETSGCSVVVDAEDGKGFSTNLPNTVIQSLTNASNKTTYTDIVIAIGFNDTGIFSGATSTTVTDGIKSAFQYMKNNYTNVNNVYVFAHGFAAFCDSSIFRTLYNDTYSEMHKSHKSYACKFNLHYYSDMYLTLSRGGSACFTDLVHPTNNYGVLLALNIYGCIMSGENPKYGYAYSDQLISVSACPTNTNAVTGVSGTIVEQVKDGMVTVSGSIAFTNGDSTGNLQIRSDTLIIAGIYEKQALRAMDSGDDIKHKVVGYLDANTNLGRIVTPCIIAICKYNDTHNMIVACPIILAVHQGTTINGSGNITIPNMSVPI